MSSRRVDEDCDGVDLNRNYQYEWGVPTSGCYPCASSSRDLYSTRWPRRSKQRCLHGPAR
ncbi:MAG: M14 family zinc carboxypeptidase [Candidatus Thalassarchaeaceae archaeon]